MRETKTSPHRSSARKPLALVALALLVALASLSFPWLATRAQRASHEPTVNVTDFDVPCIVSKPVACVDDCKPTAGIDESTIGLDSMNVAVG